MTRPEFTSEVLASFENFVRDSPPSVLIPQEHRFLADYIRSWLQSGIGVRICQGNFEKFLIASIALIHQWNYDQEWLDYLPEIELPNGDLEPDRSKHVARPVARILTAGMGYRAWHEILERDFFDACVFNTLHGEA